MRGLAIYFEFLPMIIINGSDYAKAHLFTLMHELAHIIKGRTFLNSDYFSSEKFCNEFASEILMPDEQVIPLIDKLTANGLDLNEITAEVGKKYGVSQLAVATKMVVKDKIGQNEYLNFEGKLKSFYLINNKKRKEMGGVIPRRMPQEIINLHGRTYTRAILQLYNDEEITLSKLCNALGIKQINHLKEIQEQV